MNNRLPLAWIAKNQDLLLKQRKSLEAAGRASQLRYINNRRRTDPAFHIRCSLQNRIRSACASQGTRKRDSTRHLIGCPIDQLKAQLQAQFRDGMTWENYGSHWHIDHIRPCCSFDLLDPEQYFACFHHSNLQPLLTHENLSKGGKYASTT